MKPSSNDMTYSLFNYVCAYPELVYNCNQEKNIKFPLYYLFTNTEIKYHPSNYDWIYKTTQQLKCDRIASYVRIKGHVNLLSCNCVVQGIVKDWQKLEILAGSHIC